RFSLSAFGKPRGEVLRTPGIWRTIPGVRSTSPLGFGLGPTAQHLGHAPCLAHVIDEALQELACAGPILGIDLEPGINERPDQPRPHGPLMIRGIAGT